MMHDFQIFGSAQIVPRLSQQNNPITGTLKPLRGDAVGRFNESHHADNRRGVNRQTVGFVIQADVTADNGDAKSPTRIGNAFDRPGSNCHMMSGRSGFPKFRQSVTPIGCARRSTLTFRAASATASMPPTYGFKRQYRLLPSVVTAKALFVPLMRTTAASEPGRTMRIDAYHVVVLSIDPGFAGNRRRIQ